MSAALSPSVLSQLSTFIAGRMGLNFPQERWGDLARCIEAAARARGLRDATEYVQWLLTSPLSRREIEMLASHLTVGETYFFRDKRSFDLLETKVLPELIQARRNTTRRLRIWSAGCCTGEEPYSVAMLLDRMIPDVADWNVTLLATDINPRFLEIAAAGVFGEWSFRAVPPGIREHYFSSLHGRRMQIVQRIRRMVTFSLLNLVDETYPSVVNNTNAMDLVLCRNVLMYFTPDQAARVVGNLHGALSQNGWLLVAPSETSHAFLKSFSLVSFPDAIFYRKTERIEPLRLPEWHVPQEETPPARAPAAQWSVSRDITEMESPTLMARRLANEGNLVESLAWCDKAVLSEPLDPAHRFLRAMVAQELGMLEEAMKSLRHALYLDQDFIMAHYALGTLARKLGRHALWRRHFRSARGLLERLEPDDPLAESAGITAGRLMEIIGSTADGEA